MVSDYNNDDEIQSYLECQCVSVRNIHKYAVAQYCPLRYVFNYITGKSCITVILYLHLDKMNISNIYSF